MDNTVRIIAVVSGVALLVGNLVLMAGKRQLPAVVAWWSGFSLLLILTAVLSGTAQLIAGLLLAGMAVLSVLRLSVQMSRLTVQNKELTSQVALLSQMLEEQGKDPSQP